MICPNYKNNEVKEQFNEIIESLGGRPLTDEEFRSSDLRNQRQGVDYSAMEAAYKIWHRNNGNSIDAAPNGKPSILFQTLLNHFNGDRKEAIRAKSKVYSDEFINRFGDWEKFANILDRQIEQVQVLFDKFPELRKIGTVREYAAYLATIFPNSIIKNIVYRGSNASDLLSGKGFNGELYFSPIYEAVIGYKEKSNGSIYPAILNVTKPFKAKTQREIQDFIPKDYDAALNFIADKIDIKHFKYVNRLDEFIKKNEDKYEDKKKLIKDAKKYASNSTFEEAYGEGHEIGIHHANVENIIPEIKVRNKNQVYLLGTNDDIHNFENWIKKYNASKVVDENGEPLVDDDIIGKRRYVSPSINHTGITTSDDLMAGRTKYDEHGNNYGWSVESIARHLYTYVIESTGYSLKTRKKHVKDVNALYGTNFGVYKDKDTGRLRIRPNTNPLNKLKLTKNPYDTQQYLFQKNSTDYSTEYHDVRDYLKENGIEKTELRKLKSITEPLNYGTKSLKKMRSKLEEANVHEKLIDAIIDAVKQNPNLANLQPFIIYKLLNRIRNDNIAKDYNKQVKQKVDKKLEEFLIEFLKQFGVDVLEDDLVEQYGVQGIFDILNKVIHLSKNRNKATLTEEAAHAIVRLLGASVSNREENKEYTLLSQLIESTSIYKQVYEQYKDTYTKKDENGNEIPDIAKIKEEAIGQALAVAINNRWEEQNKEKTFWEQLKRWWNKIKTKCSNLNDKFSNWLLPEEEAIKRGTIEDPQYLDISKILDEIAHDVLSNNLERFNKVDSKGYELQTYSKTLAEQTKKDGGLAVEFMQFFTMLGNSISGSLSYRLQGTVYRKGIDSLHDIDMRVPASSHNINLDEFIPRTKEWMAGTRIAAEYPYFQLILNEYPEMRILSAYGGLNNTAVVSIIYSKDTSISKRFIELPPNMNYKQRLDTFTEEEQSQIYLFDFFLDRGEIDTIHDDEYNINLDPYQVSFDAKLKIGRAKDIYDYQMFKLYKKYKSDVLSDNEHLLFQKSPQQAEQETKDAINKASKRLDNLYDTYSKMRNKTTTQQKIQNEIFELRQKVKKAQDYSIIADVIDFAISKLGVRDSSAIDVRPTDTNTVWGWLYTEDKKDNNFADVTPAQLMDAYRNMIKFHSDLFKDKSAIFNSEIIENGAPFVSHTTLKYNREKLRDLQDSFSQIDLLWTKAMIAVTDRIVEDIIDEEVDVNDRLKQNMKEVAKDYLHKNQMHGDVDDVTAWMFNYGQVPHPIIKQAFHLIQYAETMTLQELHPEATKLSQLYRKYDSITKNLHPNWQTLMMEKDKNGKYTGNFIRDINYGQYEQDLKDFLEKLSAKFEKDYGHTYIEDESGFIVNSVTGELAQDEEWNGYDEPIYVKYLKEVYKWKCEHANLRYTYDYYYERLSKPYDGDEDPNTPGLHIAGHGLSPKTLARYDYLQTNINYYLDLCIGKDGYSHPENLSPEEQQKLDEYRQRLDDLRNPYTDTGEFKPEEEKRIAFEIRAWERWLSQQLSSEVDLEGFQQAEQEIKQKSIQENNPKLYTDFIKYNATFGINPNFIDQTIGMFEKVPENSIPLVKARILKAANESLLKTTKGMTRDFRRMENNIQFWLKCKEIDQIIEDNKVKQSKDFADAYSRNFYNKMLYYQDINGNYFDIFGHQINDPDNSNSTYPTMTWFNYIVNKYVDLAKNTGTIPGLLDANGNPANFSGYTDEQIYDFVYSMFTYTTVYENEDGEEVQEDKPLSIFSMMYPIPDSFVNVYTGLTEPTLTTIPTDKFKTRKNNVYTNFINTDYDKQANIAEQPKRYDEFGNKLYDNSENYNNMREHCGELYDALTEAMKNHQKDYGASGTIFNYRLPQIEAKTAAILSRCLSNGFKNTGQMLLNALTTIQENDIDMKQSDQYLFDQENHIEHHIPLRYIRKLKDPNSIGTDITGNVILFIEMALNYKNKQGVLDQLELLQAALTDESQRVFSNTTSKNIYDSMMAKHVYGEQWHKSNQPPSIAEVIAKKSIRQGQVLETTHMLGFNILSMSTGFFDSIVRQMRESLMFKYMTPWDLTKSIAETMFRLPQILINIGNPVPNNKISAMMQINGLSKDPYKIYSHMNRGRLRKVASNLLMGGFSALDYCTQAITMNAFYKDCMFYDGDVIEKGFYSRDAFMRAMRDKGVGFAQRKIERMRCHVTLWDVYKYDSENHTVYVDPKYDQYVTDKIIVRMRTKSMQRGALYNGMNPDNDIAKYRQSIWLSIVFAMRGWLVQQVQHLFAGGDETSVRQYREEEIREFREYGLFGKKRKVVLRARLTDEQRANRMAWNYETGVPMDEIYKGIFRSFGTVWRLICRMIKFGPKEGWNKVKFSEVEKYAWRDAIITLLCLVLCMYTWIPVHEWAKKVKPVKNRKQAGVRTLNTKGLPILDITDIPRFFEEEYLGRELYKMQIDDIWFRLIESQLAGIDPATVGEIVNSVTALKNGVESHVQIFNLWLDVMGLSGKDPNGIIKNSSAYKYYTRKERFLYRFNPITKNLHSGFTYWGLRQNEKFYLDTYGYLYKWIGYDYGWGNKNSNQNQDINPITGKPMRKQGSSGASSPW